MIAQFLTHCHRKRYPARSILIRQGDPSGELYYLVRGSVTVLLEDARGREIVLAYLNPGDFFGELGLFEENTQRSALVRARTGCEVARISYSQLRGLGDDIYPALLAAMSAQMARRLAETSRKLGDLAFMDVYGRVARALLEFCENPEAVGTEEGTRINISRMELARLVGCSREMVSRVLKTMETHHQILSIGKDIVVIGVFPSEIHLSP